MSDPAPPAPEDWYRPVDHCWCGGRPHADSPNSTDYFVCERCGTHVARRRILPDFIPAFYSHDGYWHRRQAAKDHPTLLQRRSVLEADGRVDAWVATITTHHAGAPGIAVEVGCAEGTLLARLHREGWTVHGLEPDAATAEAASAATGLPIARGTFPSDPVPACDLFIACDVLEHAVDPRAFLAGARDALHPGGLLFLQLPLFDDAAPDFGPITPKVYDPWEHAFIFSRESIATALAATGFEVLANDGSWRRAHEFVVARKRSHPVRQHRYLANLPEMLSPPWQELMDELNHFARPLGLREFTTWSKIWEYPALWFGGLNLIDWRGRLVVDLGSELSPFPWWLALRGARVVLVETSASFVRHWEHVSEQLGHPPVTWQLVQGDSLPFPNHSVDVVTSLSVIEHQDNKARAIDEVARILRDGGTFALSFDIAEPDLGMTYPAWGGRALTRREFTALLGHHPHLQLNAPLVWNDEDLAPFLAWHRTTAPHHNYVTGAALLRRLPRGWRSLQRSLRHAVDRLKA